MAPFLGPERSEADTWLCAFMEAPTSSFCDRSAEFHGLIFEPELPIRLKASAFSCVRHRNVMQLSAILDHELSSACGLPGSLCEWERGRSWCWMPHDVNALHALVSTEVFS